MKINNEINKLVIYLDKLLKMRYLIVLTDNRNRVSTLEGLRSATKLLGRYQHICGYRP